MPTLYLVNNHRISWASLNGSVVKNPPAKAGDAGDRGSVPELGRVSGEGNGNPLQYSCLGNPMEEAGGLQSVGLQELDMT